MAERHQLLQAHLQAGSLFTPRFEMQQANEFDSHLYNLGFQEAVRLRGIHEATLVTPAVTYKGTKYQKYMIVVMEDSDMGYTFGKIALILNNSSDVYFGIEKYQSVPLVDLGVHCLVDSGISYVCVSVEDLADYYPLSLYKIFDVNLVPFHHSVCLR